MQKSTERIKIELFGTGIQGPKGDQGAPGKDFKFEDFTPEQLEKLRGPRGEKGEPGANMSQAWVDEISITTRQNAVDIKALKNKDEQIAQTFEEVHAKLDAIDATKIEQIEDSVEQHEDAITKQAQKLLSIEEKVQQLDVPGVDEIVVTEKNEEHVDAKLVINENTSTMSYKSKDGMKKLNMSADDVYTKEVNEDGVETIKQLTELLTTYKNEISMLYDIIGQLSELSTDSTDNIVYAINETVAIARTAVSRIEFDKINNKMNVFNYNGLVDEIDMDSSYLEN